MLLTSLIYSLISSWLECSCRGTEYLEFRVYQVSVRPPHRRLTGRLDLAPHGSTQFDLQLDSLPHRHRRGLDPLLLRYTRSQLINGMPPRAAKLQATSH